ncbi:nucleotidyltransferase family protein [Chloroflexota bacterium]
MKCLIMAGGFGTRLYPLTRYKAKALLEYEGKPLATYLVDQIPDNMDIMVTINARFVDEFINWQQSLDRKVELCVEEASHEEKKMGAVNSIHFWVNSKAIEDDLLIVAGDNYFGFDLRHFIAAYNGENALVAVNDIGDKEKASQFGVVRLKGNRIVGFDEKPSIAGSSLISTACYLLPPRIFPMLGQLCSTTLQDNLGNLIAYLIARDQVYAYIFNESWFDIGSENR